STASRSSSSSRRLRTPSRTCSIAASYRPSCREVASMSRYVGAIDQGTTSSRFIVFDRQGAIVSVAQREHAQIYPHPGWVEHDAAEIWRNTEAVIGEALALGGLEASDLAAVGITNQRETTVVWDRTTGAPLANALV